MAAGKEMEIAIRIAGKVESSLKNAFGTAMKGLGGIAKTAAKASLAAGAAVGGLATAGINVGKEFESAMSQVSATMLLDKETDAGKAAFETLENAARECGATTAFSATEAAEGLNYLALAGYDAEKAAAALPTVLKLAGAGAMELSDASDMVTDAMSALNIEATQDNLNAFADNLAMTASKSNTSVAQLGEAILTVGGTAQGLKGGTTELSAIAGILADSGIKASEGGTHIRNMIQSLQMPRNDNAAAMFKSLKLEAYDAEGNMRSLGEVFGDLNKRMQGATAEGVNETLATIFKQTDLAAARAMLAATADSMDTLHSVVDASLSESGTSMEKLGINLKEMAKGFDKTMTQEQFAAQAMKDFGITSDQAGVIYSGLQSIVSGTGNRFQELSGYIKDSAGACEDMYKIQLDNLEGDMKILGSAASDLGISFYKDVGGPIREVTQAAAGMVTQLNDAYKSGGLSAMAAEVGNCASQIVNGIAQYAPAVVDAGIGLIQNLVNGIVQSSSMIASSAGQVLTSFAGGMFQLVPRVILAGVDIITQLANSLTAQAPQLLSSGTQAIANFVSGLVQRGPDVMNAALNLIQALMTGIVSNAPMLLASAVQLIGGLGTGIMQMLPQITQMGVQLIENLTAGVQSSLPALIPAAMNALVSFSSSLRANVGKLVDAGLGLITALAQSLIANIPVFVQTIPTIVTNIAGIINDNAPKLLSTGIQLIVQLAAGIIQAVPVIISNLPQIIQAIVSVFTAFNWLSLGTKIITFIGSGIRSAIAGIPQIFSNFVQTAHNIVSSFEWQSLGRGIITTLSNGISSMISSIPQIFLNIGRFAVQAFKSIDWLGVGKAVIQLIGTAISGAGGFIVDAIKGIGGGIIDGIKGIFGGGEDGAAKESAASTVSSYASGIQANAGAAADAAGLLSTTAFSGMDFTAATNAGTQSADEFFAGLTDGIAGLNIDTSTIGLDNAVLATNFGQAGADSAAALGTTLVPGMTDAGIQGAAALGTGITDNSQAVVSAADTAGQQVGTSFDASWQKVTSHAQAAMQGLASAVRSGAQQAAFAVKSAFENMVVTIPKPRIPDISVTANSVPYGDGGNVKVPKFSVNWHAAGGIFDRPTIFSTRSGMQGVGEAGAEAVLPLDALWTRMRSIVAGEVRANSGESLASVLLDKLSGIGTGMSGGRDPQPAYAGMPPINYSPTYNLYGSAGKDEIAQADRMSRAEFYKMVKQLQKDIERRRF